MFKRLTCLLLIFVTTLGMTFGTVYDQKGLAYEIYQNFTQYQTDFTIQYEGDTTPISDFVKNAAQEAIEFDDYIQYVFDRYKVNYTYSDRDAEIVFKVEYRTNKAQEAAVDEAVIKILNDLSLKNLSDYERVQKIIDYMVTTYNYDDDKEKYTAYDLIHTKEAVCNGYAELFYKLAKGAGLSVRNQSGQLDGEDHLWNLVKIKDQWYHVDVTNQHLFKNEETVIFSSDIFKGKPYSWEFLVETVETQMNALDRSYRTPYDDTQISERLAYNTMTYTASETSTLQAELSKSLEAKRTLLDLYFENTPEKKDNTFYDSAKNTLQELEKAKYDPLVLYEYKQQFYKLEVDNLNTMTTYVNTQVKKANALKGKTFSEKNMLSAIKLLEATKNEVTIKTFDLANRKKYTDYVDTRLKNTVVELIQAYKKLYTTTKKIDYKNKYLELAKKYKITIK